MLLLPFCSGFGLLLLLLPSSEQYILSRGKRWSNSSLLSQKPWRAIGRDESPKNNNSGGSKDGKLYVPKKEKFGPGITSAFANAKDSLPLSPEAMQKEYLASLGKEERLRYDLTEQGENMLLEGDFDGAVNSWREAENLCREKRHYEPKFAISLYFAGAPLEEVRRRFLDLAELYEGKFGICPAEERIWAAAIGIKMNMGADKLLAREWEAKDTRKLERVAMEMFESGGIDNDAVSAFNALDWTQIKDKDVLKIGAEGKLAEELPSPPSNVSAKNANERAGIWWWYRGLLADAQGRPKELVKKMMEISLAFFNRGQRVNNDFTSKLPSIYLMYLTNK